MSRESFHFSDGDLLLWIDREVASQRDVEIRRHLSACWICRTRAAELEHAIEDFVHIYRGDLDGQSPPIEGPRALLKARLRNLASSANTANPVLLSGLQRILAAAAVVVLLGWVVAAVRTRSQPNNQYLAAVPNMRLTPGATSPVSMQEVCSGSVSPNDPAVPDPLRREVLKEYGLSDALSDAYQIDYLVTPQLGGAVDIRNLWPEPFSETAWNAHAKDQLEDRLHSLVCGGKLDLPTAQRELSQDWVAAYKKYFGTNEPRAISMLAPHYLDGTNRIRCSAASSTALREYGNG